jgi:hypothetical protein
MMLPPVDGGIEFICETRARAAREGPSALGIHIIIGSDAVLKIANLVDNLERTVLAPTETICPAQ